MEKKDFSPVERERASAFVKAFSQQDKLEEQGEKPIPHKEILPKPQPVAEIVDPSVIAEETPTPAPEIPQPKKVAIGAEYNARKMQEEELEGLEAANKKGSKIFLKTFLIMLIVAIFSLSFYNFNNIQKIKKEQIRILNNQKVLFDKLARIGKRLRR